jgi:signal recognition particle subunit SRP72
MNENEKRTYELCFNSACLSLSKGSYAEAETKLQKAETMCREMFEDTDGQEAADESEVENELAVIRVQLAYCLQKMGKTDEALKVYNNVMKIK